MNDLDRIITRINTEREVPKALGTSHILFVIGIVSLCALLFWKFRDTSDKNFRILIGVMFAIMLIGELLKQTLLNITIEEGKAVFTYNWTQLPFQLCSTPLYVLPFLTLLPDCRLRDFFAAYTMTVSLIGGIAVYLVPKTIFTTKVFCNIQTMIHHGLQIVSGVYTAMYYRRRINKRFYFDGICLFAVMFIIANLLNTVGYDMLVANGLITEGTKFNMFYLSPRADQSIPILSEFLKSFHPAVYIIGYFVLVSLGAIIIMCFTSLVYRISQKQSEKEIEEV